MDYNVKAASPHGTRIYRPFCFYLEELSEDDLLSQYSLSLTKKTKRSNCEDPKSLNTSEMLLPDLTNGSTVRKDGGAAPVTRNKFAAFLRRKNEDSGAVVVPGTRSRCGSSAWCCVCVVSPAPSVLIPVVLQKPESGLCVWSPAPAVSWLCHVSSESRLKCTSGLLNISSY